MTSSDVSGAVVDPLDVVGIIALDQTLREGRSIGGEQHEGERGPCRDAQHVVLERIGFHGEWAVGVVGKDWE